MSSLSNLLQETATEAVGGIFLGSIVDSAFSSALNVVDPIIDKSGIVPSELEVLQLLGEIVLQIGVGSLATAVYFDATRRFGNVGSDPSRGFAFYLGMMSSQPNLIAKVQKLSMSARDLFAYYTHTSVQKSSGPVMTMRNPNDNDSFFVTGCE
jgi:hypothetical protein